MQDNFHMKYKTIDNPGAGHCAFYAFLIGLMPILQEAHAAAQSCPALKPYMLLKKKVNEAPDDILTREQKKSFFSNCVQFNIQQPNLVFLNQGNVFLRWLVYAQTEKDLDNYLSGRSTERPQILQDVLALLEYGITETASDALQTDVGLHFEAKSKILEISKHINIIYNHIGYGVNHKLENEYSRLVTRELRIKFLMQLLGLDDFSNLDATRARLLEELNNKGHGLIAFNESQKNVIDSYLTGHQSGNHTAVVKKYIEKGTLFYTFPYLWPHDPGLTPEQRNIIERYAQYRCAAYKEQLIVSCVDSQTLNKEQKDSIIMQYLERERAWDPFRCKLIVEKEGLVDILKNIIKAKATTAQWGTATELGILAKALHINLKIQKHTDDAPISVHGNSDERKKSELCIKHDPGHWRTLIKQSSDDSTQIEQQRLQL